MPANAFTRRLRRAERELATRDRALGRVIERIGPCALAPDEGFEPFSALVSAICHQQLTGKAAMSILRRVTAQFGAAPERYVRAELDALQACGLSRAKALAVQDAARLRLDGTVPDAATLRGLDDEVIIERLTRVRGVGRWTVEMLLIFRLGRLDVWPVDDFGVRKGFARLRRLGELPTAKLLGPRGERWRPWRSVASWYLWRVAEGR